MSVALLAVQVAGKKRGSLCNEAVHLLEDPGFSSYLQPYGET